MKLRGGPLPGVSRDPTIHLAYVLIVKHCFSMVKPFTHTSVTHIVTTAAIATMHHSRSRDP